MLKYILILIAIYLLIRFVFGFLIPVVVAALKVRRKMREMQDHVNQYQSRQQQNSFVDSRETKKEERPSQSDYIEFEEIK